MLMFSWYQPDAAIVLPIAALENRLLCWQREASRNGPSRPLVALDENFNTCPAPRSAATMRVAFVIPTSLP